jgi:cytoskeletal protein CcmA (bactofilin family)
MVFGGKDKKPKGQQQSRPVAKAADALETILGPNTSIKGDVRSVDGDFEGTIDIAGNLIVTEAAKVVATITAHNVQIQGTVQGDVTARRLEILDTGKLWGDISVDSFVLDDGGFFRGQSKMQSDIEPPLLEPPKAKPREVVDVQATVSQEQ